MAADVNRGAHAVPVATARKKRREIRWSINMNPDPSLARFVLAGQVLLIHLIVTAGVNYGAFDKC